MYSLVYEPDLIEMYFSVGVFVFFCRLLATGMDFRTFLARFFSVVVIPTGNETEPTGNERTDRENNLPTENLHFLVDLVMSEFSCRYTYFSVSNLYFTVGFYPTGNSWFPVVFYA